MTISAADNYITGKFVVNSNKYLKKKKYLKLGIESVAVYRYEILSICRNLIAIYVQFRDIYL